jgi:DNA polymerase
MTTLSIDFETRSTVDLRAAGAYRYAEHPSTDVWCMAWAVDDGEPAIWTPSPATHGNTVPDVVSHAATQGWEMRAFNANFERLIWNTIMVPRYGFPALPLEAWHDTAADAAAMALPRSLGECAAVLGVAEQKDESGSQLAIRMSKPRSTKGGEVIWWDVPERLALLYEYCKQDVRTERAIYRATRRLSPAERQVYLLDQRINDRGVALDLGLIRAARKIVAVGLERVNADVHVLTGGAVPNVVTKPGDLKAWLATHQIEIDSARKSVVRDLLAGDLPDPVRLVLESRAEAGRSSVAKLKKMQETVCADGRVRGTLFYHAAGTGRWGGRGIQPQNFTRPIVANPERYVELVRSGDHELVDAFEPPLPLIASLLRGMLVPAPGYRFLVGDFAQIEARVLAWIAGQEDLVRAFRNKEPIYERMAALIFGCPVEEIGKGERRQLGKNTELGCGYGMGADTFATQAWERDGTRVEPELAKRAVRAYRDNRRRITNFWFLLDGACLRAVRNPGTVTEVPTPTVPVRFVVRGKYLYLILPSGRPLTFAKPRIRPRETPWGEVRDAVVVEGVDSQTHRWHAYALYGGLLTENVVQALARDLLAGAMLRLERAGYPCVLTVHDEIVCETANEVGSLQTFTNMMRTAPRWAAGCPIDVDSWEGDRYGKK